MQIRIASAANPRTSATIIMAAFEDGCGNLASLVQPLV